MFWIPNGANPAGSLESTNAPGVVSWWKLPSKTSTFALWKSVAYRKLPPAVVEIARPLKTAPTPERSTAMTACVAMTDGFQPRILPSSVAQMNRAGPEADPFETTKLEPAFETSPVGAFGT